VVLESQGQGKAHVFARARKRKTAGERGKNFEWVRRNNSKKSYTGEGRS